MRILILSSINSSHTEKWVRGLSSKGFTIGLFSITAPDTDWWKDIENLEVFLTKQEATTSSSLITKLKNVFQNKRLKEVISVFNPDIVHAHYATSYGLLGARSKFKPLVVSVWGSDVMVYPRFAGVKKALLKYVFSKASVICSTSKAMTTYTAELTDKKVKVIPFGIEMNDYKIGQEREVLTDKSPITIGVVKLLNPIYGHEVLIQAFNELLTLNPGRSIKLLLVGSGSHIDAYKELVSKLGISKFVEFTGQVEHREVAKYHRMIDIYVSLSENESFGVSLIEAMASGSHVVASRAEGFVEVLEDSNELGLLLDKRTIEHTVEAIQNIIDYPQEAMERSLKARASVEERYDWNKNLDEMCSVYNQLDGK